MRLPRKVCLQLTHDSNHLSHDVKPGNADDDVTTASRNIKMDQWVNELHCVLQLDAYPNCSSNLK